MKILVTKYLVFFVIVSLFLHPIKIVKGEIKIDGIISEKEYTSKKFFQDGSFELQWRITSEIITFAMKAKTIGWVSIGIDPELKMKNADINLGWVTKEGNTELFDTFCTVEIGPHPPDTDQGGSDDIIAFAGKEDGNYTTIEFSRKLITGDEKDKIIPSSGKLTITVAYGAVDEFKPRHIFRTTDIITMDLVKEKFIEINVKQAKEMIDKAVNLQILDVSPSWKLGHIPGAINIEANDLLKNLEKLDQKKATLVYCHGDAPAIFAATLLSDNGFTPVFRLLGNFKAWVDAGYPIEKELAKIVIKFRIGSKTYFIGSISKLMDTPPISIEGRTMLPIRYLSEAIGAIVLWDSKTQQVTIKQDTIIIVLTIGQPIAIINGKTVQIDPDNQKIKPIIVPPGRTLLPLRFVAERLDCLVAWNPGNQEITITYPK